MRFTTLTDDAKNKLACPISKGPLVEVDDGFLSEDTGIKFPRRKIQHLDHTEEVCDFNIHYPPFCKPILVRKWEEIQAEFEEYFEEKGSADDYDFYMEDIHSLLGTITEKDFPIAGDILDVGGFQGRLRQFISIEKVDTYVCTDPFIRSFQGVENQPNLRRSYTVLNTPCNFLSCSGEYLPFKSDSFDWVVIKSVLDHLADPYLVMLEARRVLRKGGRILISVSCAGGGSSIKSWKDLEPEKMGFVKRFRNRFKQDGFWGLYNAGRRRLGLLPFPKEHGHLDHHLYFYHYEDLIELMNKSNFSVETKRWRKAPHDSVAFISGVK